ncbi:MAG: energy-coupling factor ABC transporter permease [Deltaproteobacteria bacterium]|nr:energy-coupling factor ABC transporter permease [Deltaproteobacteria bacterium]
MHITEGIITGVPAAAYTAAGLAAVGWGAAAMKRFAARWPEKKPLLGMAGAFIFFISLIPIPAFTGTCTHPTGTPLAAILLGPAVGIALTGVSLLLQAAFFAHGGFGTWGANVMALGVAGCLVGWSVFQVARRLGLPLWAAGAAAGLLGDLAVYGVSGLILGATLAHGPSPQYSQGGYLLAIYGMYLPTQLPIALGEMVLTGLLLSFAAKRRPEVLADLGINPGPSSPKLRAAGGALLLLFILALVWPVAAGASSATPASEPAVASQAAEAPALAGMDEAVNERLAEEAGVPARDPYLDTESLGDLWNSLLLLAGGICGFILGRWWHLLWGKKPAADPRPAAPQGNWQEGPTCP